MDPAFVAFGTFAPTLQVHIVGRKLSRLAPHKQPQFKAAHPLGKMLLNGIRAGRPFLLQRAELRLTLRARGRDARPEGKYQTKSFLTQCWYNTSSTSNRFSWHIPHD